MTKKRTEAKGSRAKTHLTGVVRVEIVKPLNGTWEDVGTTLQAMRAVSHRVINHAITNLVLEELRPTGPEWSTLKRKPKKGNTSTLAPKDAYQLVADGIRTELTMIEGLKKQTSLTQRIAEVCALPEKRGVRRQGNSVSSVVHLGWQTAAQTLFDRWKKERFKGGMTIPAMRGGAPIYVASQNGAWAVSSDDVGHVLSVRLIGGGSHQFAIKLSGPSNHAHWKRMRSGEDIKLGDAKLLYDAKKKSWSARLSYSWPKPKPATGKQVMAVHRGVRNFLVGAGSDGGAPVICNGDDILAFKRQMAARQASFRSTTQERGAGARGHGLDRRLESKGALDKKEAHWVRTRCQQVAAQVVRVCRRRGYSCVVIEDWGTVNVETDDHMAAVVRRWPFAQLRESVTWACAKAGIEVQRVDTRNGSKHCPKCGASGIVNLSSGSFHCVSCNFEADNMDRRGVDDVMTMNMLKRAGHGSEVMLQIEKRVALHMALRASKTTKEVA